MAAGQLKRTIVGGLGASFETGLRHGHPPKWYFGGNPAQSHLRMSGEGLAGLSVRAFRSGGWADE